MSSEINVVLTLNYETDLTRNYTLEDVPEGAIPRVKSKVKAINANANHAYDPFYSTFINYFDDEVYAVQKISDVKIVAVTEDVIYSSV